MKAWRWSVLVILLLFLSACAGHAPQVERGASQGEAAEAKSIEGLTFEPLEFHVPEVDRQQTEKGITLYLKEDHELPLVEITAMLGAGSISIPADKTGLAGIFAALLRTGGSAEMTPEEVDQALELMAADLSVSAGAYTTDFNLSLQSKDLEEGLAILADLMRQPRFDPGRLEIARKQAVENIRRQNDQPDSIASRALMKAIYGDHPLGRTPTEETLNNIVREDLQQFHERFFHPSELWVAVSGDFDRTTLLPLLQRFFGDWNGGVVEPQKIPPVQPDPQGITLVARKDLPQTTVVMGQLGIDKSSPDLHAVRVMNYILGGGGFNSRLMREIRSNRGLAYSVYSYFQVGRRLPGPFVAGTETKSSSTLQAAQLMRDIIARMRQEPVSENDLNLARESLINSFIFAFTDTHDIVTQQMRLDYYDYPEDYLQTYRDKVAAVTVDDVLQAARKHLDPDRQKIVLVGEVEQFDQPPASLGMPVENVPLELLQTGDAGERQTGTGSTPR